MDLGLTDKVALVTGTGSQTGFGKAIAMTLAREGCDVISADVFLEGAERTAADIRALGRKAIAIKVDITKNSEVSDMVETALAEFGKIDILVNDVGVGSEGRSFLEAQEGDWDLCIDTNIKGTMYCTKAVLPHMLSRKYGKIINIASGLGKTGGPPGVVYPATKGAVITFTKSIAATVAASGINVNCVCPGRAPSTGGMRVATSLSAPPLRANPAAQEAELKTIPSGRYTQPQDIANMVTFLASDVTSYIVGQPISVNGGRSMI
jgi:NAD(P)-dependent dehydrogenase (short-subunit alcohol dehydrogenase family)